MNKQKKREKKIPPFCWGSSWEHVFLFINKLFHCDHGSNVYKRSEIQNTPQMEVKLNPILLLNVPPW